MISTVSIDYVTYHLKGLCHSKMELNIKLHVFYVLFYNILVNTFYFHKVLIHIQSNKV